MACAGAGTARSRADSKDRLGLRRRDCTRLALVEVPETRFAKSADGVHVAYQVWGEGPFDLVVVRDPSFPVDLIWEEPSLVAILERLGGFARNIWMDARGAGSSDALTLEALPNLDTWHDDLSAVMAAVGSSRAALAGFGAAGCPTMFFAASFPEHVSALILFNAYARFVRGGGYPYGLPPEMKDRYVDLLRREWGTSATLDVLAPSMKGNERWCRWFLRSQRLGTSGAGAGYFFETVMGDTNVLDVLASIQAPTLVVHRRQNPHVRVEHGRYLAEHIPGCTYKELAGDDHAFCAGDTDALVDEIEEFLTGVRPAPPTERVLATVLFTDIVGSSQRASKIGDQAWRTLLDAHDAIVRAHLERYRGREVKTTGDGVLATFDAPARAIRCACAIRDAITGLGLELRSGLHTGEIEVRGDDVTGIGVVIGQRVSALARPNEVLVSRTLTDLVAGSGINFDDRGEHELKGVPGTWRLFAVKP
jgi:class 3 adenylate cyclase